MQLLVSVADPREARAALAGGADLIDAKEPRRGALGAVAPDRLRSICEAVGAHRPVSAALGDARQAVHIERAAQAAVNAGVSYVKVGFRGIGSAARVRQLAAAAGAGRGVRVILVGYRLGAGGRCPARCGAGRCGRRRSDGRTHGHGNQRSGAVRPHPPGRSRGVGGRGARGWAARGAGGKSHGANVANRSGSRRRHRGSARRRLRWWAHGMRVGCPGGRPVSRCRPRAAAAFRSSGLGPRRVSPSHEP
jgi:hypothetical protein